MTYNMLTYKGSDSHLLTYCIDKATVVEKLEKSILKKNQPPCNEHFVRTVGRSSHAHPPPFECAPLHGLLLHPRMEPKVIRPAHCPPGIFLSLSTRFSPSSWQRVTPQVSSTSVNVSWHGLLLFSECADNIRVKHFRSGNQHQYEVATFVTYKYFAPN